MVSYLPDLREDNISLYLIPVFWMIAVTPRFWACNAFEAKTSEKMDARMPRDFVKTIEHHTSIDVVNKGRLRRAEAAVANSFENFGPFAAAVVAGSTAKLNPALLNVLSIGYLLSRIAYSYLYIQSDTPQKAKARTFAYLVSMAFLFTLFVKAGGEFKNAAF